MRKITCFYLSLTFIVYCSGILFTMYRINDGLISKPLSLSYIIIDSLVLFYIIYRFCFIKKIHTITKFIKSLIMIWNIAFFCVIIYLVRRHTRAEKKSQLLSQIKLITFLSYELIAFLKFYFHIISLVRVELNKENSYDSQYTNNESCWSAITIQEENEELSYKDEKLKEIKKENRNLNLENKRLKEEKIQVDHNIIKNKKIEIIINYIKSKYNKNISKDLLTKKLLYEIKNKCGLIIDIKKYEEIIINYIKENVFKFLICPLSNKLFDDPYITPEGQTFEENNIMEEISKEGKNPITNNNLKPEKLIRNKLILDICEIISKHESDFNIQHFKEIKQKLISNQTKKLYENPYVISKGNNKGDTVEENEKFPKLKKYPNLVIKNIIDHNIEIFDDNFLKFDIELGDDYFIKTNSNMIIYDIKNHIDQEIIHNARRELPSQ